MSKLGEYLKETKAELKHVSWPSKNQAVLFTVIVVVFSIIVAIFLGAFDYIFTIGLKKVLELKNLI
jgi:preprotein translocase subunit SecE